MKRQPKHRLNPPPLRVWIAAAVLVIFLVVFYTTIIKTVWAMLAIG